MPGDSSTVNMNGFAGDEGRRLEEHDATDDVLHPADAANGLERAKRGVGAGVVPRGLDDSWRHGVDTDPSAGKFDCKRPSGRGETPLGQRRKHGGGTPGGGVDGGGRDVYDGAPAAL